MSNSPESDSALRRMLHELDGPVYNPVCRLETVSKEIVKTRIYLARLENLQGLLSNDLAILNAVDILKSKEKDND